MGRRSRKRGGTADGSSRAERDAARRERAAAGPATASPRTRRGASDRPQGPWGSFPLTELVVLLGLTLAVTGFIVGVEDGQGRTMFAAGIVLGALAGLELAIRDHFAGHRSHSTLLAGAAAFAVITTVVLAVRELAPSVAPYAVLSAALVAGAVVFALVFRQLRRVFQERSGGLSFR